MSDDLLATAAGASIPRRPEYQIVNSLDGIPARAGGILSCRWAANPGFESGTELRVSVLPMPDRASVEQVADNTFTDCYRSEIAGGSTSCYRTGWTNGYWVAASLVVVPGPAVAEADLDMDALYASIGAVIEAARTVAEPSVTATSTLATRFCTDGAATFAALRGTEPETVTRRDAQNDGLTLFGAAAARAGVVGCTWEIADGDVWTVTVVPGATWAADDPLFTVQFDGEGGTLPLTRVDLDGATAAYLSCEYNCVANLIVDRSAVTFLRSREGTTAEAFAADVARLVAPA